MVAVEAAFGGGEVPAVSGAGPYTAATVPWPVSLWSLPAEAPGGYLSSGHDPPQGPAAALAIPRRVPADRDDARRHPLAPAQVPHDRRGGRRDRPFVPRGSSHGSPLDGFPRRRARRGHGRGGRRSSGQGRHEDGDGGRRGEQTSAQAHTPSTPAPARPVTAACRRSPTREQPGGCLPARARPRRRASTPSGRPIPRSAPRSPPLPGPSLFLPWRFAGCSVGDVRPPTAPGNAWWPAQIREDHPGSRKRCCKR